MNKTFDRLALPNKINYTAEVKNNSSFISIFQLNHINKILPDYEDLITSL